MRWLRERDGDGAHRFPLLSEVAVLIAVLAVLAAALLA